jgi:hypothetical protein
MVIKFSGAVKISKIKFKSNNTTGGRQMKKVLLLTLTVMFMASMAFAQGTGSVSGTVLDSLNNPIEGALIGLMGHGGHGGHGQLYHAMSGADGTFSIADVAAGSYLAAAVKMMIGQAEDSITVVAGQNTVVNFVLGMGHNPPPPPPDSVGSVSGTVLDSLNNPIEGAMINLLGEGHHGEMYHALSGADGTFSIADVEAGSYLAIATKMMVGYAEDSITVVTGQNTVVNFVLGTGHNPPPPPQDSVGSVSGTVVDTLNNPVGGAMISLMGNGDDRHHGGMERENYFAHSDSTGAFSIANVIVGDYMAMASKMMVGHAVDSIAVVASQNTVVNFILAGEDDHHHGGGGHRGDSLEIVNLTGWAIVIADSSHNHYFLDVNGDDTADFRLEFGPPWYDPGNGAHRPNNGDSISITGGLMGFSQPQAVIVYDINGLFWRQPGHGHGGHGGHGGGCPHPDSVVAIEISGQALVEGDSMRAMYFLDTNFDNTADYVLVFGPPAYNPGNGATRPANGDSISIVGGLLEGPRGGLDHIIVYEINGLFWWRDPGDTLGLWPQATSVNEPEQLPAAYLIASSYPNPFNPTAIISFTLPTPGHARVSVYDILGREVAVLADGNFAAGENQVQFNANQQNSSAVYFYKVTSGTQTVTGKMVLLK